MGYIFGIFCTSTLTAIFGLAMLVVSLLACIRDPQRKCSNQFIKVCVHMNFLVINSSLVFALTIPAIIIILVIPSSKYSSECYKTMEVFVMVATICSAVHLFLVFLFHMCFMGPVFCILEVRNSPFFSTILKYSMTLSLIIATVNVASGVSSIIASHLSDSKDCENDLKQLNLRPAAVVAMFSFNAAVNFIMILINAVIVFLNNCSHHIHAVVLCCCLFHNLQQ